MLRGRRICVYLSLLVVMPEAGQISALDPSSGSGLPPHAANHQGHSKKVVARGFSRAFTFHIAMAQYKPRERKRRRLDKQKEKRPQGSAEPIPDVIIPESQAEREARRAKLAADLRAQQPESRISSKKRKRLEKYVDSKLKKEENLELLKKLAAQKVDTSLLQSSKKLGRVSETKRERFSRVLQERQAGLKDDEHENVLFEARRPSKLAEPTSEASSSAGEDDSAASVLPALLPPINTGYSAGSGLKRPLETDESGRPIIAKRKRRKKHEPAPPSFVEENEGVSEDDEAQEGSEVDIEDEWHGFGSEASVESEASEVDSIAPEAESEDEQDHNAPSEDEAEDESDPESPPSTGSDDKRERVSAFKQWADMQRNTAVDFTPSTAPTNDAALRANFRPRAPSPESVPTALPTTTSERTSRPAAAITIPRSPEIQSARLELPVVQEEQQIMEAIHHNPVTIVCGATGSGKTTQVPQMMYESGYGSHIGKPASKPSGPAYGMIGVTQPRRVAATSVAERVATELGPQFGKRVAHQVRYDNTVGRETAIKFMTDGILLREISQDFLLSRYSAIVIDEAHERSVITDILIGMLSRIVPLRAELAKEMPTEHYPLKLVIMSATLKVADFAANKLLFRHGPPPIVEAEGRQFSVTVHFSRRTQRDYVSEMVSKVARGHRKLPPGGVLVFLTSQNEIQTVAKRLREKLGAGADYSAGRWDTRKSDEVDDDDFEDRRKNNDYLEGEEVGDPDSDVEITGLDPDEEDKEFDVDGQESSAFTIRDHSHGILKPHVLPLYAALPSKDQLRVFQPVPLDSRLIVLATNVAETSLTIPGIRYVFDCGRAKEKRYDISTGVQTFEIDWISKASASQRTGRAGRTGPGHCYRLYSSAVYEQFFAEHTVPEILRTPLESTVLQLKGMEVENVGNFPFPTRPDGVQLALAERLLKNLGAIGEDGRITEVGKQIMQFPVSPRFGKMLLLAQRNQVVAHVIAVVAGLAVGDLYIPEAQTGISAASREDEEGSDSENGDERQQRKQAEAAMTSAAQQRHQAYTRAQATLSRWDDHSDVIKLLTAVAAHADASSPAKPQSAASKLCADFFLREKGMTEVQQLRHQLQNIVSARYPQVEGTLPHTIPLPTEKERVAINQIVAAGYLDQVAIRADLLRDDTNGGFGRKPRRAGEVAYRTLVPSCEVDKTLPVHEQEMQRSVFVHPASVLAKLSVKEMPNYIIYSHLSRAPPSTISDGKVSRTRLHPLTVVGAKALAVLAEGTPLLDMGKPVGKIEDLGPGRRQCWASIGLRAPGGEGSAWPLGAWKVVQKRSGKGAWGVEKVLAR